MTYDFKCNNIKCKDHNKEFEITCKHTESKSQVCLHCGAPLSRVWNSISIRTSDGYKG